MGTAAGAGKVTGDATGLALLGRMALGTIETVCTGLEGGGGGRDSVAVCVAGELVLRAPNLNWER